MTLSNIIEKTHPEWHPMLQQAFKTMDKSYLEGLAAYPDTLPNTEQRLAAFSEPLSQTEYILWGESPYPRSASANGYAFWDAAVESLWSETGLSKAVNRATSFRNFIKMLLRARGDLTEDCSQTAIAALDRSVYQATAHDFFNQMMKKGFMLLNASLVYEEGKVPYHAKHWAPFMESLLAQIWEVKPDVKLILFGKIAEKLRGHTRFQSLVAEHPYNISFISNQTVIDFFKPLDLLAL